MGARGMMRLAAWVVAAAVVMGAASAAAQTPATVTGAVLEIRQNGVPMTPGRELASTLASQWACDLAPAVVPTAALVNPTKVRVPDLAKAGRECELDVTAFIRTLPVGGNYTGWMWAVSEQIPAPDNRSATAVQVMPSFSVAPIYTRPAAFSKAYFLQ